ncbi:MAG: PAS domain S-box-containing protein [Candidatus Endobugula sp.]|jgi:PAS domain S-box-containing protein
MKTTNKNSIWFVSALILVTACVLALFSFFSQLKQADEIRQHTYTTINSAQLLLSSLKDAETGQRGFLLTGDEAFLAPYMAERNSINGQLEQLQKLTKFPTSQEHLVALVPLVKDKLSDLAELITLKRSQEMAVVINQVRTEDGKRLMDLIRAEMYSFIQIEQAELAQRELAFQTQMRRLFAIIVFSSLFMLIFAVGFMLLVHRNTQQQLKDSAHKETQRLLEAQKAANQKLDDQQFYTRSLIESNIDALITTDSLGIISDVNKQMEVLTSSTRDELIGTPFKSHFTDPEHAEDGIKHVLKENKVTNYELTARALDGKETDVSYNATTFYNRNQVLQGVFAAARDITERKCLDRALEENRLELETAKYLAEKANRAKSNFLSGMSHELRTPLSAILGFAQLLESAEPAPSVAQKRSIDQILQAGWYLLDLINEILDLALIESGKLSLSMEPVSLAEVIQECKNMIEPEARKRGIKITFPHFTIPHIIYADRMHIKQVLINLLSNAIKYNKPDGSVILTCTEHDKGQLRIAVTDTGEGLSADEMAQLFQPFNRIGQELNAEEGTGIGLVMTKRLIELMEGEIGVESTVGEGSLFWVELSLTSIKHTQPIEELVTVHAALKTDSHLHTLLYVEDNPANLMLVEELITRRPDINLITAPDGPTGVALAQKTLPKVILMDINLPGISGIDALQLLRKNPRTEHIPVVALSANAIPRDIQKGIEAGFFHYLTKPIRVNEFMDTLNSALIFSETKIFKPFDVIKS